MARRTGQCLCGAIRIAAEFDGEDYGACHCGMCRRWAGGPLIEAQASELQVLKGTLAVYRSSDWGERLFCAACGTHVGWRMRDESFLGLNPQMFDPPLAGALTMEVFVDAKPDGYAFAGDHQRLTGAELQALFSDGPKETHS